MAEGEYTANNWTARSLRGTKARSTFETVATSILGVIHLAMPGGRRAEITTICGARLVDAMVGYDADRVSCEACRRARVGLQRWMQA